MLNQSCLVNWFQDNKLVLQIVNETNLDFDFLHLQKLVCIEHQYFFQ